MPHVRCYVLMGGMWGFDGSAFSRGMAALSARLNAIDQVVSTYHYWSSWPAVEQQIRKLSTELRTAVIGYSGGGSRLTYMKTPIDMCIGYDPSPAHEVKTVHNFTKAICYHNRQISWFMGIPLGGGQYEGGNVTTYHIDEHHLKVQFDESLHQKTLAAIEQLRKETATV